MNRLAFSLIALVPALVLALAVPVTLVGCSKPESTEPTGPPPADPDHPATYAVALAQMSEYKAEIQNAFAQGKPDDAHDALHAMGHTLSQLPDLAGKSSFDKVQADAVTNATEKLLDTYDKLDASMHGGDEVKYETLQPEIDEAFKTLEGIGK